MKFKNGDRVKVINCYNKFYGATGTVVKTLVLTNNYYMLSFCNYYDKSVPVYGPYIERDLKLISEGYAIKRGDGMLNKDNIPEIRNVYFNDPLTCVIWTDGTKTFVKNADGDHNYDSEKALAMAISKKALGNKYNYYKEFEKWLPKEDAKFSLKSLLEVSKELSKSLASFGATTKENYVNKRKMALTKNPVEKAYLTLLKVNDDPTSKGADFAAAIEEAIGYLGEALDD